MLPEQDWLKDDLLSKVKLVAERRCYEKGALSFRGSSHTTV
jgi:hypothetical protein